MKSVRNQICHCVCYEVWDRSRNQIIKQARDQVESQVRNRGWIEIEVGVRNEIWRGIAGGTNVFIQLLNK